MDNCCETISTDLTATNYGWWCLFHDAGADNPHYCTVEQARYDASVGA